MISLSKTTKAKRAARDAALCTERERLAQRMTDILARTRARLAFRDALVEAPAAHQILPSADTMDVVD